MNLPQTCVCGKIFSVEHAFTCPFGGFPSIRHYEIRDFTASLLSKVCCDVGVEPALQPLDHEPLWHATANREDGAHLDIVARDFWGEIGSIHSLTLGCLILLHAPIKGKSKLFPPFIICLSFLLFMYLVTS